MNGFLGTLGFAFRRIRSQAGLVACQCLGVAIAVALAAALPAFVDAVQSRVLRQALVQSGTQADKTSGEIKVGSSEITPNPFAFRFTYPGSTYGLLTAEEFKQLDNWMSNGVAPNTILPLVQSVRYVSSSEWRLQPQLGNQTSQVYVTDTKPLAYVTIDALTDFDKHIVLEDGVWPTEAPVPGAPIDVVVYQDFSTQYGVGVGDVLSATARQDVKVAVDNSNTTTSARYFYTTFRVVGVWRARDAREDYWLFRPSTLGGSVIVPYDRFETQVAPLLGKTYGFVMWNFIVDVSRLTTAKVGPLVARAGALRNEAFALRKGLDIERTPFRALENYVKTSQQLIYLMVIFSAPIFVVVLYFVTMVSAMVVRRQEPEITVLRSRGVSVPRIVGLYIVQGLIIGIVAFIVGLPLGHFVAGVMVGTRTFLSVDPRQMITVERSIENMFSQSLAAQYGLFAAVLGGLSTLIPAIAASRTNVVAFYASRGRNEGQPFWQRLYLDVALVVPSLYGYWQLKQSGSLAVLGRTITQEDPLRDPLRYLLPVFLIMGLGLFVARILPLVMRVLARLLALIDDAPLLPITPLLLAARELARSPGSYLGTFTVLILTVGIASYGASTAKTLDQNQIDAAYFTTGADVRLAEDGENNLGSGLKSSASGFGVPEATDAVKSEFDRLQDYKYFLPVDDHLGLAGVKQVARIGIYEAHPRAANIGGAVVGTLVGLDWRKFAEVSRVAFRPDYSRYSFNALMNSLGANRDGVLVSERFLSLSQLHLGDKVFLEAKLGSDQVNLTHTIVGTFQYFPGLPVVKDAPQDASAQTMVFIANLDFLFAGLGKEAAYDVLLSVAPGTKGIQVADNATAQGYIVSAVQDARSKVDDALARPERQGLFGVLTIGFVATTLLSAISFILYALISFRQRAIELGVLRTIGLSQGEMRTYLTAVQLLLVLVGMGVGSGLGSLASHLFIPFLQSGSALVPSLPPFKVELAWSDVVWVYIVSGATLVLALIITQASLGRLRAFEAVKLGSIN